MFNPTPIGVEEFAGEGPWIAVGVEIDDSLDTGGKLGGIDCDAVVGMSFQQFRMRDNRRVWRGLDRFSCGPFRLAAEDAQVHLGNGG